MDKTTTADAVICGAGIAGISAAYFLASRHGLRKVILVDERPPLSLTSDKSSECYRNWWPGPDGAMLALMNRSIDILEELAVSTGNRFHMNRRGYLYVTKNPEQVGRLERQARLAESQGAGPLRIHGGKAGEASYQPSAAEGFDSSPVGADLLIGPHIVHSHFTYVSEEIVAALHVRRAGWLSAQQLGMYLLEQAEASGARLVRGRVAGIETGGSRVKRIRLESDRASHIDTPCFVNAAGPFIRTIGAMLGSEQLPIFAELHLKAVLQDPIGAVDRSAPLVISADPLRVPFSTDERQVLAEDPETRLLLDELPSGLHARPEGGPGSKMILLLWPYHLQLVEPVYPIPQDQLFPEVALRGLAEIIPALRPVIRHFTRPAVDGGYYMRTPENRPLIGPLPAKGAYILGALSGFGIMAACACGELLAAYLTGSELPWYAPAFQLERYADPVYQQRLENWDSSGQL